MNDLLIDMGNTRLKSARLKDGVLGCFESETYAEGMAIRCFEDFVSKQSDFLTVIVVSVLGERFQLDVEAYCQKHKISLLWAASSLQAHGVRNSYLEPERLGSDRFVALVGARKLFPKQYCIVIDCGTAVTIDALTDAGVFSGGVIIPGLQLLGDSLTSRANQLNAHQLESPSVFAKDTEQAIGSGSLYGLVGAIDGVCQRMEVGLKQKVGSDLSVVKLLCGGDASLIAEHSSLSFEVLPHLVLTGLAEFTEQ